MIEGSYNLNDKRLHTFNRIVIATGSGPDHDRLPRPACGHQPGRPGRPDAVDIQAIMHGFTVAAKK